MEIKIESVSPGVTPRSLLTSLGAFYARRKYREDQPYGPLVGCAERGTNGSRLVGDAYFDMAKVERHPAAVYHLAAMLVEQVKIHGNTPSWMEWRQTRPGFFGHPLGGRGIATELAREFEGPYLTAEVEKEALVFHEFRKLSGPYWIVVGASAETEDPVEEAFWLLRGHGAEPAGVLAIIDSGVEPSPWYRTRNGERIPRVSLIHQPLAWFPEDDPHVAEDIAKNGVVRDPQADYKTLMRAMGVAPSTA